MLLATLIPVDAEELVRTSALGGEQSDCSAALCVVSSISLVWPPEDRQRFIANGTLPRRFAL